MKKSYSIFLVVIFLCCIARFSMAQEKRIYNDGVIDYVPITASFMLSADDTESTLKEIQYSVDGSPIKIYTEPITFDSEGRHVIVYWAVDMTGNISPEKIYSVVVDGTPPEGLVSVKGPSMIRENMVYITEDTSILLWAEDNLSGVDNIYVQLDDGGYLPYTEPVFITEEGIHRAAAYAVDNVGNRSDTYTIEGYVDNTPPEVKITTAEEFVMVDGKNFTNRNNVYTVEFSDNISGTKEVLVSMDGSEFVTYAGSFRVQIPGYHTLKAKAIDNLGNESLPVEIDFFVDVIPPASRLGTAVE